MRNSDSIFMLIVCGIVTICCLFGVRYAEQGCICIKGEIVEYTKEEAIVTIAINEGTEEKPDYAVYIAFEDDMYCIRDDEQLYNRFKDLSYTHVLVNVKNVTCKHGTTIKYLVTHAPDLQNM